MMITTCTSSERTSTPAGAPMARSRVSARAFWSVMIRKKSPVTSGTTRAKSRKMTSNERCTSATPGVSAAASARVSASASSEAALMRTARSSALMPAAGRAPMTLGSTVVASGFAARVADT